MQDVPSCENLYVLRRILFRNDFLPRGLLARERFRVILQHTLRIAYINHAVSVGIAKNRACRSKRPEYVVILRGIRLGGAAAVSVYGQPVIIERKQIELAGVDVNSSISLTAVTATNDLNVNVLYNTNCMVFTAPEKAEKMREKFRRNRVTLL